MKYPARLDTLTGKDNKNNAFNVTQFVTYLHWRFGKPTISTRYSDISKATNCKQAVSESIDPFTGKTGIIAWHVHGRSDATGHFTLWNGITSLYEGGEDYFKDFPR
jgi:Type VI secretion system (T6SS), amidase effector protein 4